MSVSVVAGTLFLACIYILYPMFYMHHVTGRNKVVYCIYCIDHNCADDQRFLFRHIKKNKNRIQLFEVINPPIYHLQGCFKKRQGCHMTSSAIVLQSENVSKVYVCFVEP